MIENSTPVVFAVLLANAFGVVKLVLQARRSITSRKTEGLSPEWIGMGLAMNLGWIAHSVIHQIWALLPVSIGSLVLYGAIWVAMGSVDRRQARRVRSVLLGVVAVFGAGFVVGYIDGFGLTLALLYTVQFAPAASRALNSLALDGLSPATWLMAPIEAFMWVVYGITVHDPVLIVGGLGAAAMSAVVCLRVLDLRAGAVGLS